MTNPFGEPKRYHYGEVETPFQYKGQQYDVPIGEKLSKAKQWRMLTFIGLLFSGMVLLLFMIVAPSQKPSIIVSEITPNGMLKSTQYLNVVPKVPVAALYAFVEQYLNGVLLHQEKGKMAFARQLSMQSSQEVKNILTPYALRASTIDITHVSLIKPDVVNVRFHVSWQHPKQKPMPRESYDARISFKQKASLIKKEILVNPFGFYIVNIKLNNITK